MTAQGSAAVALASARGRWLLGVCVLGTVLIAADATMVRIALPAIGRDLDADFSTLQWVVTAYSWTLASAILLGGAAADVFGRRRIFIIGVAWFSGASLLCAAALSAPWLIAGRLMQGLGAALLAPTSLAVIQAGFRRDDRARAVGAWVGLAGLAGAVAPFLAGWLLDAASWRWVFLINPALGMPVVLMALRHMPETRDVTAPRQLDAFGALLCLVGLGGAAHAAIALADHALLSPGVLGSAVVAVWGYLGFWFWEGRARHPMLPRSLFGSRQFTATNAVTFLVYGAINGFLFLMVIELQVVAGLSPLAAGAALLPLTALLLALSSRSARLSARFGPRLQLVVGPLVCAVGVLLALRITSATSYGADIVPAVSVFGLGMAITVAPLNAAVLSSVSDVHTGLASGVNNAVACAAGLLAVATLPAIAGLGAERLTGSEPSLAAFRSALIACAAAMVAGAVLALLAVRNPRQGPARSGEREGRSGAGRGDVVEVTLQPTR